MNTKVVEYWTQVPFIGIQINKFKTENEAFNYAKSEYLPFGYNVAYFSKDIQTLFISKTN